MEAISIRSFNLVLLHLQGKSLSQSPEKQTSTVNRSQHPDILNDVCAEAVKLTDEIEVNKCYN